MGGFRRVILYVKPVNSMECDYIEIKLLIMYVEYVFKSKGWRYFMRIRKYSKKGRNGIQETGSHIGWDWFKGNLRRKVVSQAKRANSLHWGRRALDRNLKKDLLNVW